MSDKKAIPDGIPFPAGNNIPFALWVRTSLRQKFADVVAEPVPAELLDILFSDVATNGNGMAPARNATPTQEPAREDATIAPGSGDQKITINAG
ncbi:hypothetical protein CFR71_01700 [Novacetimonas pomaceti]|uniref:Anti-sigma factor NepR domain-containing protein n=1 Tax=Novacetimonas pomaceti TaxID=2021998 RepID=A0A318QHV1_9PROT|nr:hypothetical protein CFR71_01700 [Novacetimonas pomaceti]